MGPNGMHPQGLRELADIIARPLLTIFYQSWQQGAVSGEWRKVNVTPVFKGKEAQEPTGQSASPQSLER